MRKKMMKGGYRGRKGMRNGGREVDEKWMRKGGREEDEKRIEEG